MLALVGARLRPPRPPTGRCRPARLFTFQGDDVFESSGLVDRGDVVYTNNDSGDDAVVYGVDSRTGRTVSRTTYADEVTDVEAIAPGADGTVWAGDTGDNRANRDDVAVYRRARRATATTRRPATTWPTPTAPHDAETLLVQPRTQRVLRGLQVRLRRHGVRRAPPPAAPTRHQPAARRSRRVGGLVTDGTFFPDGRHVLLRTYGTATVYTFPGFEPGGHGHAARRSRRGRGSRSPASGRVLVSSEGVARRGAAGAAAGPADLAAGAP